MSDPPGLNAQAPEPTSEPTHTGVPGLDFSEPPGLESTLFSSEPAIPAVPEPYTAFAVPDHDGNDDTDIDVMGGGGIPGLETPQARAQPGNVDDSALLDEPLLNAAPAAAPTPAPPSTDDFMPEIPRHATAHPQPTEGAPQEPLPASSTEERANTSAPEPQQAQPSRGSMDIVFVGVSPVAEESDLYKLCEQFGGASSVSTSRTFASP